MVPVRASTATIAIITTIAIIAASTSSPFSEALQRDRKGSEEDCR
jgi:hypothetical protein